MDATERPPALDASFPALPAQIAAMRRAVVDVARCHGARDAVLVQIRLAVSEAATNAVLHAYRDRAPAAGDDVRVVVLAHRRGSIEILVRDRGLGPASRPDSPGLGLGLRIMARASDRFEIRAAPGGGTEVVLGFAL